MPRLPIPGSDEGAWGDILNEYLRVGHNNDGTHKTIPVTQGGTGATTATNARTNLGVPSTTQAQAMADTAEAEANTYTDTAVSTHTSDTTNIHGITDTSVLETQAGSQAKVDTHINDTTAAHAASSIAFTPSGSISATNVQSAIQEVAAESGASITLSDINPQALSGTASPGTGGEVSRHDHVHPDTGLATDAELSSHATTTTGIHGVGASTIESTTGSQTKANAAQSAAEATAASALSTHEADTSTHGVAGAIVGTTDTQTLTNKTLTSPVINIPTGIVKGDVGLANVDNTSDANKPVSTAQQTALDAKLDLAGGTMTGALTLAGAPTVDFHAATKAYVDANGGGGGGSGGASFVGVRAVKNTNQSIPNSTGTAVSLDFENFDTDGFHDNSTNNTRFTVPTGRGGKYLISAAVQFNANSTGARSIAIHKNGTLSAWLSQAQAATEATVLNGTAVLDLVAGDYIELYVSQNSGAALDIVGGSSARTALQMVLLDTSVGTAGFVGAKGHRATSAQSITSGSTTAIELNAESFDSNNFHDTVTNNTRITVPAGKGGKYLIVGQIEFSAHATGYRLAYVRKNGTTTLAENQSTNAGGTFGVALPVSAMVDLSAGDYVELIANHDAGTAINANIGEGVTFLAAYWLEGLQAQVGVKKAGALVGTRQSINFIEGSNVTLTVADDAANGEVDVTIASTGGGSSGGASFVGVTGTFSSTSTSNNIEAALDFAETVDTDGFHDNATNPSRITIPSGRGGKYLVTVTGVGFSHSTAGARRVSLYKNGTLHSYLSQVDPAQNAGFATITGGSAVIDLVPGDYIHVSAWQNSGGALTVDVGTVSAVLLDKSIGASGAEGCRVYLGVDQSVGSASNTSINFDQENFDSFGYHSTTTNTSRVTIPSGRGGKYLIMGQIRLQHQTGQRQARIHKNGSLVAYTEVAPSGADQGIPVSTVLDLVAGDYIELVANQNSGVAINAQSGGDYSTWLSVIWLDAVASSGGGGTGTFNADDGTAAAPSLTFAADGDTGIFRPADNTVSFTTAGIERMKIRPGGKIQITQAGGAALSVSSDGGTTDNMTIGFNGVIAAPDGGPFVPSLTFLNDQDTGLYLIADGVLGVARNGVEVAGFGYSTDQNQHLFRPGDGVVADLGWSSRPWRDVYITGDVKKTDGTKKYEPAQDTLVIPAGSLQPILGSPTFGSIYSTTYHGAWMLDASSGEYLGGANVLIPQGWSVMDVEIWWTNHSGTAGNVVWVSQLTSLAAPGESIGGSGTGAVATAAAGPSLEVKSTVVLNDRAVTPGKMLVLTVGRNAGDAGDTFTADADLLAIVLRRVS